MEDFDPEELEEFHIPEGILKELFELTGESENSRGFLLACVGQDGRPFIYMKASSPVVELGVRKAMEQFLVESQGHDSIDYLPEDTE